jgi:hypothetical protein
MSELQKKWWAVLVTAGLAGIIVGTLFADYGKTVSGLAMALTIVIVGFSLQRILRI